MKRNSGSEFADHIGEHHLLYIVEIPQCPGKFCKRSLRDHVFERCGAGVDHISAGFIDVEINVCSCEPYRFRSASASWNCFERGLSTREIAQFSGFCIAAVRAPVRQRFGERRTLEPRRPLSGRKTLLSEERKQEVYSNFSPHSPTPRWPSWARAWTGSPAPPRSISGCGGWVGGLKKTIHRRRTGTSQSYSPKKRARWREEKAGRADGPSGVCGQKPKHEHQDDAPAGPGAGWAKTVGAHPARDSCQTTR